ncbi:MAG: hypothetical protein ACYC5H_04310 [Methylovirgula sp.]
MISRDLFTLLVVFYDLQHQIRIDQSLSVTPAVTAGHFRCLMDSNEIVENEIEGERVAMIVDLL